MMQPGAASEILVREYTSQDERAVEDITYRTGFNGLDLTGRGYFDDRRLFFLIFISYYTRYEPQHCFVAEDTHTRAVVGFVVGTEDTHAQERAFQKMLPWKVLPRVCLVTLLRYPRTMRTLARLARMGQEIQRRSQPAHWLAEYPAHLHINVLPEYHSQGIGGQLIRRFEAHMRERRVKGVHLQTSNYNRKAIPFYQKMGFSIVEELELASHPVLADYALLTFAKKWA